MKILFMKRGEEYEGLVEALNDYLHNALDDKETKRMSISLDDMKELAGLFIKTGCVKYLESDDDLARFSLFYNMENCQDVEIKSLVELKEEIDVGSRMHFIVNRLRYENSGATNLMHDIENLYFDIYMLIASLMCMEEKEPGIIEREKYDVFSNISSAVFAIEGLLEGIFYIVSSK